MKILDDRVPQSFRRSLTGPLRLMYVVTFINAIGSGLTLSFFVIYLHNVRHFSTAFSTTLLAAAALVSLTIGPLWGTLVDRFGPAPVGIAGLTADALALLWWGHVTTPGAAITAALALAAVGGAGYGPTTTMLARLCPDDLQHAFGFNFMLLNLGIGFGGLISASIVDLHHPITFTILYSVNAAVTLVSAALLLRLWRYGQAIPREERERHAEAGWRTVLHDRRLVRYVIAAIVLITGGYGSQEAGYSLFVVNKVHLTVHLIGVIFFFNTSTIVVAQLFTLSLIQGRSRTRVLAVVGVLWALFWVSLDLALHLPALWAFVVLAISMSVFAFGETMLSPVGPALVNQIAPEHLRGRYNAAAGLSWGLSGTVAPLLVALYFGHHLGTWWPLSTAATALLGSALMLSLRRHLSPAEDGRAGSALEDEGAIGT